MCDEFTTPQDAPISAGLLRTIFEEAGEGIFLSEASGHLIEVNPQACRMLGYSRAELLGRAWSDLVPAEDLAALPLAGVEAGPSLLRERQLRRQDGHLLPVEMSSRRLADGCLLSFVRDITPRKQAQAALQQSEARFAKAFQANPLPMSLSRQADGHFIDVNDSFLQFFGYHGQQVIGHTSLELGMYRHPDERAEMVRQLQEQGSLHNYELIMLTKSGTPRQVLLSIELINLEGETYLLSIIVDITAPKQAEDAFRQSEEKLRLFIEHAPAALAMFDPEMRYLAFSHRWVIDYGLENRNIMGRSHYDIFPEIPERWKAVHRRGLAGETMEVAEDNFERLDGTVQWLRWEVRPWYTIEGSVGGIMIFTEDISERKRTEVALRQSKERFASAFRSSPSPIAITRLSDRKLVDVNEAWCQLCGYRREEALGHTSIELGLSSEKNQQKSIEAFRTTGQIRNIETYLTTRAGKQRHILISTEMLDIDDQPHALSTLTDITQHKRAKKALKQSEARFRATFEQAAVGIAHVRPDGRWLRVNQKLCDIVGYSHEEMLGRTFQELTHPDDLEADLANTQQALAGEIESYTREKRYLHKDGSLIWINLTVSLVRHASGEPDYFIVVIQDITEAKGTEEQLGQAQKMESVGRLAGGIAHDFNNLLTVIQGYAELMQSRMALEGPLRHSAEQIQHAAESATALTRQLLAFSRKQILAPTILDLNDLVHNLQKMLPRLIGEDILLETDLAADLHPVLADPGQLEQVLLNLAVNARDAMPTGGHLTIETANVEIDQAYLSSHLEAPLGPAVMLAVTDSGQGMDKQTQAKIFEPFFTTKEVGRGTGLGLATVHGIVKQSGGDIQVYSEPGQGATFKIYLPAAEIMGTPRSPMPAQTQVPGGSETILLVEDEETVRNLVLTVLQEKGYTLLEARQGGEALALVRGHTGVIDLLITDVIMPGMSGRRLAEQLAALRPGLKTLYISGYTDDTVVRHGLLTAEVEFLSKPFSPATLAIKVRQVLDK